MGGVVVVGGGLWCVDVFISSCTLEKSVGKTGVALSKGMHLLKTPKLVLSCRC